MLIIVNERTNNVNLQIVVNGMTCLVQMDNLPKDDRLHGEFHTMDLPRKDLPWMIQNT